MSNKITKIAELKNGKRFLLIGHGRNYTTIQRENGQTQSIKNSDIKRIFETPTMLKPLTTFQKVKRLFVSFLIKKLLKIA